MLIAQQWIIFSSGILWWGGGIGGDLTKSVTWDPSILGPGILGDTCEDL